MQWWGHYIGRSFGSRSECWSLVCEVYRDRLGIDLPAYGDVSAAYVAAVHGQRADLLIARQAVARAFAEGQSGASWRVATTPVEFDVVLMGGPRERVTHVGVAIGPDRVLHIEKATGSVVVPMRHASVAGRIIGFRRHVTQCSK